MRAIKPTGAMQEFADDELRGFVVRVTPKGSVSYCFRYQKLDGSSGRPTHRQVPGDAAARST